MVEFTEDQIQAMVKMLKDEFNPGIAIRELAVLELEDLKRKGCTLENLGECHSCSATKNGECPLCNWEKRHPEYANDELAMKIKILEAGGKKAYKEKLKRQEEAKREAERATDTDKVEAARYLLNIYFKSKIDCLESDVLDAISNVLYAKSKPAIQEVISSLYRSK